MSRPESIEDIELSAIEFGSIDLSLIADDGAKIKAYGAFMEALQKSGASVEIRYNTTAKFSRPPNAREKLSQLDNAQMSWDNGKKLYETLRDVGEVEYSYQRDVARNWAEDEGLPFPPEHEPISEFHAVIRDIDEATA